MPHPALGLCWNLESGLGSISLGDISSENSRNQSLLKLLWHIPQVTKPVMEREAVVACGLFTETSFSGDSGGQKSCLYGG